MFKVDCFVRVFGQLPGFDREKLLLDIKQGVFELEMDVLAFISKLEIIEQPGQIQHLLLQVNRELGVVQEDHHLDANEVDKSCCVCVLAPFEGPLTFRNDQAIDLYLVLGIPFGEVD